MRLVIAAAIALAVSACGTKGDLKPAAGASLPPAPHGEVQPHSAEELLEVPAQADLGRSIELRKRSEERATDPFDLPPEG